MTRPSHGALQKRIRALGARLRRYEEDPFQTLYHTSFCEAFLKYTREGICVCRPVDDFPFVRFTVWNDRMVSLSGYTMEEINIKGWYQSLYPDPEIRKKAMARMTAMRADDDLAAEEWEAMTGYTREESLELSSMAIVHPDMRETVHQRAAGRLRGEEQPTRYKIKFTTRNGEARWGDFSVTVIDFDGQPAILSMARDITTQIETEERLHASEKRLAEIIDVLPDATWVVDQEGKVVAWKQAIEKLTSIPAKDIIGKGD